MTGGLGRSPGGRPRHLQPPEPGPPAPGHRPRHPRVHRRGEHGDYVGGLHPGDTGLKVEISLLPLSTLYVSKVAFTLFYSCIYFW